MDRKEQLIQMNTDDLLKSLMLAMSQLIRVVEEEDKYLDNHKIDKILESQPRKLKIIEEIELFEQVIRKRSNMKSEVSPAMIAKLSEVQNKMSEKLLAHHHKMIVARKVNHKIVEMVAQVVMENTKQEHGYDARGSLLSQSSGKKIMPPLSLNSQV